MSDRPRVTFLIGCTACGKGSVSFELAQRVGAEIVSVDSMKVFRRMDIGTAKPSAQRRAAVPYHLIDVAEPSEEFNVAKYAELADRTFRDIQTRGKPILAVGGTALYLKILTEGIFEGPGEDPEFRQQLRIRYAEQGPSAVHALLQQVDPVTAARIHPNDYKRLERALEVYAQTGKPISELQTQWEQQGGLYDCRIVGLRRSREDQNHRINQRARRMMDAGLLLEVKALLNEDKPLSPQASQAVGYAELIAYLAGECTIDEAFEQIKINSRQLAKHQRTWFRRFNNVQWFDLAPDDEMPVIVDRVCAWYQQNVLG